MKFVKYFLLSIIILDIIALIVWGAFIYRVSSPLDNFSEEFKIVDIKEGIGLNEIALQLENESIISDTPTFVAYVLIERKQSELKAGEYVITPDMSIKDIVSVMAEGTSPNTKRVTFPEGYTSMQMADRLVKEGILQNREEFISFSEMTSKSTYDTFEYNFLNIMDAPLLEGLLFPDTYDLKINSQASAVIDKMLKAFNDKAWPILQEGGKDQASPYSSYELLIIASLLEEEVQSEEDMKNVAGILYNRLEIGMPLQVDATLAFITGKQTGQLTNTDKEIDSPYNTYQNRGLPPAPISNPGLRAIEATLNPTENDYLYYLTGRDGNTYFGRTLEEHNDNKQKYLR